jgi:ribosomal protein L23
MMADTKKAEEKTEKEQKNVPVKVGAGKETKKATNDKASKKVTLPNENIEKIDPYQIIKYPLSTEKSIRQIEFDNKLTFAVHPRATKTDVKQAVEDLFKVKVVKVNIQNSFTGQKRACVKLSKAHLASDVSADLGLI